MKYVVNNPVKTVYEAGIKWNKVVVHLTLDVIKFVPCTTRYTLQINLFESV